MYQNASPLAAFPLIHHSITGRSGRSWIGGPIIGVGVRDPRPGQRCGHDPRSIMRARRVYRVRSRKEHPSSLSP